MKDERLDHLVHAHLNGGMAAEERCELEDRLLHSAADRLRFWELAETHSLLHETLQGKLAESEETRAAAPQNPHRSRWRVRMPALRIALAAGVALTAGALIRPWKESKPELELTVASLQGAVDIATGGRRRPAAMGGSLQPGERIRTAPGASAVLRLADGTRIHLEESTDLGLSAAGAPRALDVKTGMVRCAVAQQPVGRPWKFTTPHAELIVLGTVFDLLAAPTQSRVHVAEGRVRWTDGGQGVEVTTGEASTADHQGLQAWTPVCDFDFRVLPAIPPRLETVFCDSRSLHTSQRKIVAAPEGIRMEDGGMRFADQRNAFGDHGLIVTRWAEPIGGDVAIEVGVTSLANWSLQLAVDGDSFDGYRIIFAAPDYPHGIAVDSLHPSGVVLLAQDPRPLPDQGDHTLRVEKRGQQLRVWVDRELRIDTALAHALDPGRTQNFALGQFGSSPIIRSLRVWKAAAP